MSVETTTIPHRQQQPLNIPNDDDLPQGPPPPYVASLFDPESDPDPDPETDLEDPLAPHEITIDASTIVVGTGNFISTASTSAASLSCAANIAAALSAALRNHQRQFEDARPVKIRLECGIKVQGVRNVVGGLRAASVAQGQGQGSNVKAQQLRGEALARAHYESQNQNQRGSHDQSQSQDQSHNQSHSQSHNQTHSQVQNQTQTQQPTQNPKPQTTTPNPLQPSKDGHQNECSNPCKTDADADAEPAANSACGAPELETEPRMGTCTCSNKKRKFEDLD